MNLNVFKAFSFVENGWSLPVFSSFFSEAMFVFMMFCKYFVLILWSVVGFGFTKLQIKLSIMIKWIFMFKQKLHNVFQTKRFSNAEIICRKVIW